MVSWLQDLDSFLGVGVGGSPHLNKATAVTGTLLCYTCPSRRGWGVGGGWSSQYLGKATAVAGIIICYLLCYLSIDCIPVATSTSDWQLSHQPRMYNVLAFSHYVFWWHISHLGGHIHWACNYETNQKLWYLIWCLEKYTMQTDLKLT